MPAPRARPARHRETRARPASAARGCGTRRASRSRAATGGAHTEGGPRTAPRPFPVPGGGTGPRRAGMDAPPVAAHLTSFSGLWLGPSWSRAPAASAFRRRARACTVPTVHPRGALQRGAFRDGSFRPAARDAPGLLARDPVELELAVERLPADAEDARCERLVAT